MSNLGKLKVLHVIGGSPDNGSTRGAINLVAALQSKGIEAKLFYINDSNTWDGSSRNVGPVIMSCIRAMLYIQQGLSLIASKLLVKKGSVFTFRFFRFSVVPKGYAEEFDIIHLHWVPFGISEKFLNTVRRPVVWTLRDMRPFTGGCHVSRGCREYESACGNCPQILPVARPLPRFFLRRAVALSYDRFKFIALSNAARSQAINSTALSKKDIDVIPNSINFDKFRIVDIKMARSTLNLNQKSLYTLIIAKNLSDPWKGYTELGRLYANGVFRSSKFLIVGAGYQSLDSEILANGVIFGDLGDEETLNYVYNSASLTFVPYLQDAFGKTTLESLAVGTRVLGYRCGGTVDIVDHRLTGYLTPPGDVDELVKGFSWIVETGAGQSLEDCDLGRRKVRQIVQSKFSMENASSKYIKVYREIVAERTSSPSLSNPS